MRRQLTKPQTLDWHHILYYDQSPMKEAIHLLTTQPERQISDEKTKEVINAVAGRTRAFSSWMEDALLQEFNHTSEAVAHWRKLVSLLLECLVPITYASNTLSEPSDMERPNELLWQRIAGAKGSLENASRPVKSIYVLLSTQRHLDVKNPKGDLPCPVVTRRESSIINEVNSARVHLLGSLSTDRMEEAYRASNNIVGQMLFAGVMYPDAYGTIRKHSLDTLATASTSSDGSGLPRTKLRRNFHNLADHPSEVLFQEATEIPPLRA